MQHIRLIQSVKWHQKEDKLYLFLWNQKITLPNNLGLAELFYQMQSWQEDYTREVLIEKYKLSSRVVDLLITLWVFICLENCAGPEARYFHAFVENPSSAYLPEQQEEKFIASLYQNLEHFFLNLYERWNDGNSYLSRKALIWIFLCIQLILREKK